MVTLNANTIALVSLFAKENALSKDGKRVFAWSYDLGSLKIFINDLRREQEKIVKNQINKLEGKYIRISAKYFDNPKGFQSLIRDLKSEYNRIKADRK